MTHLLAPRFRRPALVGGLTLALLGGGAGAALAGTSGGHDGKTEHVKPHCVIVPLAGSAQFAEENGKGGHDGYGDGKHKAQPETYSATATALVCEAKNGDLKVVKIFNGAASETEAQHK